MLPLIVSLLLASAVPDTGDAAPALAFKDAAKQEIYLDQPGVLYVVDFWATWCGPCRHELPDLERLAKEYEAGGKVKFISVVDGTGAGKGLLRVAKDFELEQPVYADSQHWQSKLGVSTFPTKFFIRDGKLLLRAKGAPVDSSYEYWKPIIDRFLAGDTVAVQE